MIIGVILTIALLFLIPVVLRFMNVPEYDTYTPSNIFGRAGELVNRTFGLGNVIKESQQNNEYRGNLYYDTDGTETSLPEPITQDQYKL